MARILVLVTLTLAARIGWTGVETLYVGAGVARSDYGLDNPLGLTPFDDEDTGFRVIAGWRPLRGFGIEADYVDHGRVTIPTGIACTIFITAPCASDLTIEARTASVFAAGYIKLHLLDLFAKAGVTAWQFDGRFAPTFSLFQMDESGTEFAWGAGGQAKFGQLGARLEYEQFNIIDDERLETISLSLIYAFK